MAKEKVVVKTSAKKAETNNDNFELQALKENVLKDSEILKKENEEIKKELANISKALMELMKKPEEAKKEVEEKIEDVVEESLNEFDELQDIHTRYRVRVTSLYNGGLNLRGLHRDIRFDRFGQTKVLHFEDVEAMTSNNESFFRNGLVFIHDHRVLKLIYMEDAVEKFIEPDTLKRIFELPTEQIKTLYKNTTKDLQNEIVHTFAEWINKNDVYYLDKNKINVINELSGKDVRKIAESLKEYSQG